MLETSPFAALSLIAAPALMTNATSLLVMSTSNRLGRTVDRARALAREVEALGEGSGDRAGMLRSLDQAQARVLIAMRALMALYFAAGTFAAGTLSAFLGAVLAPNSRVVMETAVIVTVAAAGLAFVSLVIASGLLMQESRLGFAMLRDETNRARRRLSNLSRGAA